MDDITDGVLTGKFKRFVSFKQLEGLHKLNDKIKVMITKSEHKNDISDIEGYSQILPYTKFKGKFYLNTFYIYSQNVVKLWHGSKIELEVIKCFESSHSPTRKGKAVPVCFASINRFISASFIPHWNDSDFTHGTYNGKWYMIEMYEDAFKMLEMEGYLHQVSNKGFYRVPSLGLDEEYINEKDQEVLEVIKIENVREYIKDFFIFKPWKLVWNEGKGFKTYEGKGEWHPDIFKAKLKPVVLENGVIIKNEHLAKLAKFVGQDFAYV